RRAAEALRAPDAPQGGGRRGGGDGRRGLPLRARTWHAPDRRLRHGYRPADHAPHRAGLHSRCHLVPSDEVAEGMTGAPIERHHTATAYVSAHGRTLLL